MLNPQPGDLILVRGRHWYSRVIEWFTRSPYSHAAVWIGNGNVVEALFNGVVLSNSAAYTGQDVYARPDLTQGQRQKIVSAALSQVGKGYGWGDVLYEARLDANPGTDRDCSTLAAWCYAQAGAPLTRLPYPTPGDLADSEVLQKVGVL